MAATHNMLPTCIAPSSFLIEMLLATVGLLSPDVQGFTPGILSLLFPLMHDFDTEAKNSIAKSAPLETRKRGQAKKLDGLPWMSSKTSTEWTMWPLAKVGPTHVAVFAHEGSISPSLRSTHRETRNPSPFKKAPFWLPTHEARMLQLHGVQSWS